MAISAGASLLAPIQLLGQVAPSGVSSKANYYPPTLTGMMGNHNGAFETSHNLTWRGIKPSNYTDLDEAYGLAVVGAGISGLAAASLYQQKVG